MYLSESFKKLMSCHKHVMQHKRILTSTVLYIHQYTCVVNPSVLKFSAFCNIILMYLIKS